MAAAPAPDDRPAAMRRGFPPWKRRPRGRGAEPSIPWQLQALVALLGARRIITPPLRRRLELTGLTWDEMAPVLARIHTIDGWARIWQAEATRSAERGDFRRAAAQAFLGHLPLSPFHPRKAPLLESLRRYHTAEREATGGFTFERVSLASGALAGYLERPVAAPEGSAKKPLVLLLPPLASTKEELAVLADPLLAAGHPVLRLDLPGQGESPPPLALDAERLLVGALDELGVDAPTGCFAGGISLGAHFALRLGGADPARVRGVFGVSPPAIVTPEQWARQEEVIWQYLDLYFGRDDRQETRRIALSMTLEDRAADLACPVLLFHAARDPISLPDKAERYRGALSHVPLEDQILEDFHGCALRLRDTVAPAVVAWCERTAAVPADRRRRAAKDSGAGTAKTVP